MYMADYIFPVLPIKDMINEYDDPTTSYKLATGKKPLVSFLCVLFCPYVLQKDTAQVGTKALNMRHQAEKGFHGILVGIPQHQKGYLVYVPITRKIISSYDVVFDEILSSKLAYTSDAIAMHPAVTYTLRATSPRKKTGGIITFAQFEEVNISTKTCNNAESSDEYNDNSIMTPEE